MLTTFDPDKGPNFKGEFTKVKIIDPAFPGQVPNLVIDPTRNFDIELEWKIEGFDVPLYLAALGGNWDVEVFAESLGPGPELRIAQTTVAAGPPGGTLHTYATTVTVVAPSGLLEGNPGPGPSGVYKLVVTVFLNSNLGAPGFDICGFAEGPVFKVENPI